MRGLRVLAVGLIALIGAWFADRWLFDAYTNAGAFGGGEGARELLLVADRVPKLILLVVMAWVALEVVRDGIGRAGAAFFILAGIALAVLPSIALLTRFEPVLPIIANELYFPRHFVLWTATGLLIVGLLGLVGAGPRVPAGPWVRAALAVALVALLWPADSLLNDLFIGAAEGRTIEAMITVELVGRVGVIAALTVLLVAAVGSRHDMAAGGVMAVAGAVVFIGFALAALPNATPSMVDQPGIVTGHLGRWMAGGVLLLGLWELWLTRSSAGERAMVVAVPDRA